MTLILPIKREWFKKIERGEKTTEYREAKPYWTVRLRKLGIGDQILFRNGYSANSPSLLADYRVTECLGSGSETDLCTFGPVYAIHFDNVCRKVQAESKEKPHA